MAKIWDIDLYCLEEIQNSSNKIIKKTSVVDSLSNVYPQGQDSPIMIISGLVYNISLVISEVQKKQVFGLCSNYYENRFLIFL